MSYLVLARKWRPQAFDDVTGQEHVVRTLSNAIAQGRVAHALLLCGPRGVGKTTTARLLARALNCEAGPTADPCGACEPCREIAAGSAVDVVEIDGASNNSVDNVREIRETVRYLPQRDRHKVFIIDEVHMLSVAAFNALLKTLEEPPPHVKFIFATTDPQKLPDTILSRCQRHNFRRVPSEKMVERLRSICDQEGISVSDRILESIADQSDGGMRDSLSLLDRLISSVGLSIDDAAAEEAMGLVDSAVVSALVEALLRRDGARVIQVVEEVYERGVEPRKLCEETAQRLRDLLFFKTAGKVPVGKGEDAARALASQAELADAAQLTRLFDLVHGTMRELSFAARPRLALEVALLNAVHMAPAQGLADLAARLEGLAAGGAPGQQQAPPPQQAVQRSPAPQRQAQPQRAPPPREPAGPGPATAADLIRKVEAMAGQAAPRQSRSRPAPRSPSPGSDDDDPHGAAPLPAQAARPTPRHETHGAAPGPARAERPPPRVEPPAGSWGDEPPPHGDEDLPGEFSGEASRTFPMDAAPGGCASGACAPGDDPTLAQHERWRRLLDAARTENPVLHPLLAEGRLAWIREGEVALGFDSAHGFHRAQIESGDFRRQAEELFAAWFGRPMRLRLDVSVADAPTSVAEEERRRREDRAKALRSAARESAAVRMVQAVLGGEIQAIEVIEEG